MGTSRKGVITGILLMLSMVVWGQETFDQRLAMIEKTLDEKAKGTVPGLLEVAQFSVVDAPIQDLIRGLAEAHQLNVSISPKLQMVITNNFTNVVIKDLLLFLCREYHINVEFVNNIISFSRFEDPPVEAEPPKRKMPVITYDVANGLLSVDLVNDSLSLFVRELSRISGKNVLMGPQVEERLMNGYVSKVPFLAGIDKIAFANGLLLEADSLEQFFMLRELVNEEPEDNAHKKSSRRNSRMKQRSTDENLVIEKVGYRKLNIEAINVPISDIIKEAAYESGTDYIFFSKPEGNTFIKIKNISFEDLLEFLLQGTDHTFIKQDNVHIIGSRIEEGFRKTKLLKFQYRTAWEIEKSIPEALLKNIQVLPFEELNALILSGSAKRVDEIEKFLKEIDQPVPNIMIDVMVIDVRKSHTIETGLSAFLGDTVVKTQGKIYPSVDATLGSNSINSVLSKLETASSVNLGRVKPNFYVKLKALEQNGNIKIKSTPKLSTLNGHEAVLTIGESVYYQEKTQNVTGGVNPIITTTPRFNKVDANLTIKIKPMVSGDENVTLDIEAEFSDFLPPEIQDAPPGNATRKFVSQIRVQNEEMVLLGGLEETQKEKSGSGLPILSRIPVLKWFFSSRKKSNSDNKLLVLIKPQIVY
ncbi:general secretion pathway protein GspD [Marinilabiliaceae bacterium JC017]|nr:general secretion pathway protein GspD [Marinilabiliaceae bacterium JC017]